MTLDEFVALRHKQLSSFSRIWTLGQIQDGKQIYPTKMNEEDWQEHFRFYLDSDWS